MSKFLQSLILAGKVPFYVDYRTGSVQSLSGMVAGVAPTVISTPKFTQTKSGRAADFRTGYLSYPHQADQLSTSVTVMGFGNFGPLTAGSGRVICKRSGTTSYDLSLISHDANTYISYRANATTFGGTYTKSLRTVAACHVGGRSVSLYSDGVQVISNTTLEVVGAFNHPITVGALGGVTGDLNSPLYVAVLINEALSPADIARLHRELVDAPGIVKRARKNFISYATVAPARHCLLDARVHTDGSCPVSLAAVPAQGVLANGWKVENGTWRVVEDAPANGKPGKRWLKSQSAGTVSTTNPPQAYGSWHSTTRFNGVEQERLFVATDQSSVSATSQNGYGIHVSAAGAVTLRKRAAGVASTLLTPGVSLVNGQSYEWWVEHRSGQVYAWVRGGTWADWTFLGSANDATVTTGGYQVHYAAASDSESSGAVRFLGTSLLYEAVRSGLVEGTISEPEPFIFATTKQTQSWQLNLTAGSVYTFDWGDGVVDWYVGTGALQTVTHNYAAPGTYQIKCRIDNPLALTEFLCNSNELSGPLPSFAACTNLINFWCHINQFSGTLPSFATCVDMINFWCSTNQFDDYAPGVMPTTCTNWRGDANQFPGTAVDAILADFETNIAARPATGAINVGGTGNAALGAAGLASRDAIWAEKGALNWPITHN